MIALPLNTAMLRRISIALVALASGWTSSPPPTPDDVPSGPQEVVEDWPRVPEGMVLGKTLGVAIDH